MVAHKHQRLLPHLLLLLVACVIAWKSGIRFYQHFHGEDAGKANPDEPVLVVSDDELRLGRVYETNAYDHSFHIVNCTNNPVTISHFETTCDCIGITPAAEVTLLPHERKAIALKLKPISQAEDATYHDELPFRVHLSAVYSIGGLGRHTKTWELSCVIVPTVRLKKFLIRFGTVSEQEPTLEESVGILATSEIHGFHCDPPWPWAVALVREQESGLANRFRLIVRSRNKLSPGTVSDIIQLTPLGRDNKEFPVKELKIDGEIVRDVTSFPREVYHGRQPCETSAQEAVQLRSLTGRRFEVKKVASESTDLEINRLEALHGEFVYSLRLHFTKRGQQEALARFYILEEEGIAYEVAVSVRYHGMVVPQSGGEPIQ